ncbi:ABC transporter A family member 2-like [Impatiens glandulifera]|uniref:ABC transporter A family member 2-like n=1 Tax=Impatiens glandulifera TaxID=253017 RepID=UPI001FB1852B|nr:ABC transporter A family member 2-like [Impatiens glandulifera]
MELQSGFPLLRQQFKALYWKNVLLSWRHKRSTFTQLFSSLFFIFLIFCIQKAIQARYATTTSYKNVFDDSKPLISPPIIACEDKFYTKVPCFDFVWSGNDSSRIVEVVRRIKANNPGRPIPDDKVISFRTRSEVDTWLLDNTMRCPGALHFIDRNATVISYGLQTNSTPSAKRGHFEDPTLKFQIPLQIAAEREIARTLLGDPNFSWVVQLKEFAHPALQILSAVGTVGPTFFLVIAMFGFVFQMSSLVTEKELKLRQAMTIMGLYDTAYWLSWLSWEGMITALSALFSVLFGMMFQFDFFLNNNFAVLFLLFFLFQLNMTGFAFMLSAFISKSSSATTVGFSLFIFGFLAQLVTQFGFPYSSNFSDTYRFIWSFFPPNLLAEGLLLLSDATSTPEDAGISWSRRAKCAPNDQECVMTMNDIFIWLVATFFLWFVLAIYFDNIIPNSSGVRKSVFYFLYPGYWTGKGGSRVQEGGVCSCRGSIPPFEATQPDDGDVLEEEITVKKQVREGVDPSIAVQIRGFVKVYPGTTKIGCCRCNRTSNYHALKGLWVNFTKDQLFCLLGPNGAGKTTAINCLTGITPVTEGDALIYGHSVRSAAGMSTIRRTIGVCPQFDILWDVLSGEEHLHLFAAVKGLPPSSINDITKKSLAEVKLAESSKTRAGSYSGGMKRRLSVAIALIGDPKLVILDEPTTGMDPITRRHVWDIIESSKKGRAIILTTHSMEEADILGDRIGIVAKGRLRCIGTSIRLKSKFGTGFVANVSFSRGVGGTPVRGEDVATMEHQLNVKKFFKQHLNVTPKEENKSFLTFVIPHDKEDQLSNFFEELQDRQQEFGIGDIQLGLTTLEEVFLNIAKKAEVESAAAEGTMATLTLTSGSLVQIPVGARFIGIPGTESPENPRGVMVEVFWEQDDSGTLCISSHSPETPIPSHVQLTIPRSNSQRFSLGSGAPVRGFLIDPSQITNSS